MHGNFLPARNLLNRLLRVTLQADAVRQAGRNAFLAHFVGQMAVRTGGNRPWFLFPHFAPNYFRMDLFDLGMANLTSLRDVIGRRGRPGIKMGKNKVVPVAIVACGGDDEPPLEQTHPVNALGIVVQDIFFRNIVGSGDGSAFPVTFPAKNRDIHFVGEGVGILLGQNVVVPVTLGTGGGVRFLFGQRLPVDACAEVFIRIIMTVAAFHGSQFFGMGELFYIRIRMTPGASRLLVNGAGKFLQIDIKGNGLTFSLRGQLFIRMTLHAVFVRGCAHEGGKNQGT